MPSEDQPGRSVLGDLRVIDLTVARAGPTAVRQLSDWGASVLRIEMPGDDSGVVLDHDSSDYANLHANKRLMTLDLKSPAGLQILFQLLENADVLVENFRAPVKQKLGISYEHTRQRFPRLIYGSISGFGEDGPSADKGAVDQVIQGISGLMSITGFPSTGPVRAGIAVADVAAGVHLANGILLALIDRARTGNGQWVRVSLLEAMLSFMDFQVVRWLTDGQLPGQEGNHHPTLTPMGTFSTQDGHINIAAPSDRLWERLCNSIGEPDLAHHPDYSTPGLRHQNREVLCRRLEEVLQTRTRFEWVALLEQAGVPCGPVNSIAEAFDDPQTKHLNLALTVPHPSRGTVSVLRSPVTMSAVSPVKKDAPPAPSQHTDEVLSELGYSAAAIGELRRDRVV